MQRVLEQKRLLPKDWTWATIEDIRNNVLKIKRLEVELKQSIIYLDIGGIDNNRNIIDNFKVYQWESAPSRAQQIVSYKDILFSSVRTYLKNIAMVNDISFDNQIASSGFTVIRTNKEIALPEYVFHYVLCERFLQPLNELQTGSSYPAVRDSDVFTQPIPLPPKPEQRHIVAKIEQFFSKLDNAVEILKTLQQQLRVYRQAVFTSAFEGKLTKKWRSSQNDLAISKDFKSLITKNEYSSASSIFLTPDMILPYDWEWVRSGDLFEFVTSGSRGWAKYYSDSGAIFLRITNLDFDSLELDLNGNIQYVNPPPSSEGTRTRVQEGDFLFSITGYLGMFAIAPKLEEAYVNQHIALCRPLPGLNKRYLGYWIISKTGGYHYLNLLQKGATKAGLGLEDIRNFPIPLCSLAEQHEIVQEIESRLSVADKLKETIEQTLQQAEALRQSILKKAFEGRLLSEDELAEVRKEPDWEPARVLLERIKAQKIASDSSKKTLKKGTKKA
ncbi:MAG: restriction endonuclease subunit S [Syntrophomonas sp.]